jgi:predicted HicB family RNase H-like nuclease
MKNGSYKKVLLRIPHEILSVLEEEATRERRSLNGEVVRGLDAWVERIRAKRPANDSTPHP